MRSVSTVLVSDDADQDSEVSPLTTSRSSSGGPKHRREVGDWDRDEDE